MKKKSNLIVLICTGLGLLMGQALASDAKELIEARQGIMKLNAVYMDILGDMVKGERPYNQIRAQAAADNLLLLAKLKQGALWRKGTSNSDKGFEDLTRARSELWDNRQEVGELYAELTATAEKLVKNAGWSLDTMEESFRDLAPVCRTCHKRYREKPRDQQEDG